MRRYIYALCFLMAAIYAPTLFAQPACYKCVFNPNTSYFECQTASEYEVSHTSCISQFQFGCEMGGFCQPYLRSGIRILPDGRTMNPVDLVAERQQFRLFDVSAASLTSTPIRVSCSIALISETDSALKLLFVPRKPEIVVL